MSHSQLAPILRNTGVRSAWMEKQERAFTVWLNSVLQPTDESPAGNEDLAAKRMAARVRAALWRLYTEDAGVISVMLRLERHIDAGFLKMKDEVSRCMPLKRNLSEL